MEGRDVRFSIGLPTDRADRPELMTGDAIGEIAEAVESAGLDAVFVTDHPAPDDRWLAHGGHHAAEPTVALAFAAAATTHLRLHTNIYVLPYRNPFLAAKALGSLQVMSGGRLVVGTGAGYLRAEFAALGASFDDRNDALDTSIELLRQLWSGHSVAAEGDGWSARGVTQLPAPPRQPLIWVGGNSRTAMRRAALSADGWSPFPTPAELAATAKTAQLTSVDQLAERVSEVLELWRGSGRGGRFDICCGPFSLHQFPSRKVSEDQLAEELVAMGRAGVTWTTLNLAGSSVEELVDNIDRLAEEVAAPVRESLGDG
jgi:probable F420-dependent oxidoreductase